MTYVCGRDFWLVVFCPIFKTVKPRFELFFAAASKIHFRFAVNDVVKIVQYYLHNSAHGMYGVPLSYLW